MTSSASPSRAPAEPSTVTELAVVESPGLGRGDAHLRRIRVDFEAGIHGVGFTFLFDLRRVDAVGQRLRQSGRWPCPPVASRCVRRTLPRAIPPSFVFDRHRHHLPGQGPRRRAAFERGLRPRDERDEAVARVEAGTFDARFVDRQFRVDGKRHEAAHADVFRFVGLFGLGDVVAPRKFRLRARRPSAFLGRHRDRLDLFARRRGALVDVQRDPRLIARRRTCAGR